MLIPDSKSVMDQYEIIPMPCGMLPALAVFGFQPERQRTLFSECQYILAEYMHFEICKGLRCFMWRSHNSERLSRK